MYSNAVRSNFIENFQSVASQGALQFGVDEERHGTLAQLVFRYYLGDIKFTDKDMPALVQVMESSSRERMNTSDFFFFFFSLTSLG